MCSAFNPDAAAWCNQCFHDLRVGEPHRSGGRAEGDTSPSPAGLTSDAPAGSATRIPDRGEPRGGPRSVADRDVGALQEETPVPEGARAGAADAGGHGGVEADFRTTDGRIAWRCPTCANWSPLDAAACAFCGTPFGVRTETAAASATAARRAVAVQRAVWLNVVLPGLGHLLAGWTGSGLARMILYSVWFIGGVLLLGAGGTLAGVPLLVGAAALWITGLHDGWQLRTRGPQLLSGRALLWLVIGVTLLAVLAVGAVAVSGLALA